MGKILIMDHPLIQHKLSILRDKSTGSKEFRALISEIATLICYEATRDLPLEDVEIETAIFVACRNKHKKMNRNINRACRRIPQRKAVAR